MRELRELGVGINTLPHAIKELAALGLTLFLSVGTAREVLALWDGSCGRPPTPRQQSAWLIQHPTSGSTAGGTAVTIKGTVGSNLSPGGNATVTFTVDNPSAAKQRVGTITLASIAVDAGHSTCSKVITGGNPDFAMPAVAVNKTFPTGTNQSVTQTGTLTMNDTGVSQDACQGATLTLSLTSN